MQDGNTAHSLLISRRRFGFFFAFLKFEFIDILVHLEEAVIVLVDYHMILKHVFVIGDTHHSHCELLTRK